MPASNTYFLGKAYQLQNTWWHPKCFSIASYLVWFGNHGKSNWLAYMFMNLQVPSLKLTLSLKMMVSNRNLLFQGWNNFRRYVSFRESIPLDQPWRSFCARSSLDSVKYSRRSEWPRSTHWILRSWWHQHHVLPMGSAMCSPPALFNMKTLRFIEAMLRKSAALWLNLIGVLTGAPSIAPRRFLLWKRHSLWSHNSGRTRGCSPEHTYINTCKKVMPNATGCVWS